MDLILFLIVAFVSCAAFSSLLYSVWSEIPRSCKNAAFKEYKTRIIKNLEDEEQEFIKWLDEANSAADRAAFEQFKASEK